MDDERISRLEHDVAELRAAVTAMHKPTAPVATTTTAPPAATAPASPDLSSRRGVLKLAGAALAGAAAAGAVATSITGSAPAAASAPPSFHPITPTRVYDSRSPTPAPGPLAGGLNRLVSVADGRDLISGAVSTADVVPIGTTAIACNVTVSNTVGAGFLTVNPGGNVVIAASTINWFGPGQILANGVIVTISADRNVTVIAGGGGQTDFILDVTGYFQ